MMTREMTTVLGGRFVVSTVQVRLPLEGTVFETIVFEAGSHGDEVEQIRSATSAHAETVARWERAITEIAGVPMLAVPARRGQEWADYDRLLRIARESLEG